MRIPTLLTIALALVPGFLHAQTVELLVQDLPYIGTSTNLASYLQNIFKLTLGVTVTAAVVIIIINGVRYMTSDAIGGKADAISWIKDALWGLVLAFASVLILSTINPQLVQFDFLNSLHAVSEDAGIGGGGGETTPPPAPNTTPPDGALEYQPGIRPQRVHASPQLEGLLQCMGRILPGNVGEISSISDKLITSGQKTFEQCAHGGCAHREGSLHYGGRNCVGKSFAVDFGDQENAGVLTSAAQACVPSIHTLNEGDHIHISFSGIVDCGSTD